MRNIYLGFALVFTSFHLGFLFYRVATLATRRPDVVTDWSWVCFSPHNEGYLQG